MIEKPYRSYCCGQSVMPVGSLQWRMQNYYPVATNKLIIDSISDECVYKIRPVGYNDILEATHWDLLPTTLVRTRYYVPNNYVLSGVIVRPINNSMHKMVMESMEQKVLYSDGSISNIEPVEILCMLNDDPQNLLCYLQRTN